MTDNSHHIFKTMQVRHSDKQKAEFRLWLVTTLRDYGYETHEEGTRRTRNLVVGDPDSAKIILTAHYDTPAVSFAPNKVAPSNGPVTLFWTFKAYWWIFLVCAVFEVWLNCITNWSATACMWIGSMPVFLLSLSMLYGPANKHNANDNTSGVVTLLEIAQALPERLRHKVCFVFFDNEEKGLLGSAHFAKHHKGLKQHTPVLNFDCVGDGDTFHLYPNKGAESFARKVGKFYPSGTQPRKGRYSSDQRKFTLGVGVCALRRNKLGIYYLDRIHTGKDRECAEYNIDVLRDCTINLINAI